MSAIAERRKRRRHRDPVLTYWLERVDGRFMGLPIEVDPHEALLHAIKVSAGEAVYCDMQIARLQEDELFERPIKDVHSVIDGELVMTEIRRDTEIMSRWVQLRDLAIDRMAKYAKMALDAGVSERQVQVAERVANVMEPLLRNLADDLNLTPDQQVLLPAVISKNLKTLESTAQGVLDE